MIDLSKIPRDENAEALARFAEAMREITQSAQRVAMPRFELPNLAPVSAQWAEAFRQVLEVGRAMSSFTERIASSMRETDRAILEHQDAAYRLGRCGWTLPMRMSIPSVIDLLRDLPAESDLDEAFGAIYAEKRQRRLREVTDELCRRKSLEYWRPLLGECVASYYAKRYLITIPSLVSIFEGTLAMTTNTFLAKPSRAISSPRNKRAAGQWGLDVILWASIQGFTERLFENVPSWEPRPLNRHRILHGRDEQRWARVDAIRLFTAIDAVAR